MISLKNETIKCYEHSIEHYEHSIERYERSFVVRLPGKRNVFSTSWESQTAGDFGFTVFADAENNVSESDETNNQVTLPITVKPETAIEAKSAIYWTQFQGGSDRNGVTEGYAPLDDSVKLKWSADDFGGNIDLCPIVVGDNVYVLASSGELYAYNKTEGKSIWHAPLIAPIENYGNITVAAPQLPAADFTSNITSGSAPLSVTFSDLSTNSPTSWAWDFDNDGVVDSTDQNPTYTFTTAGNYTVNLTVTNSVGSDSTVKTDYITVSKSSTPTEPAPVAAFTADVTSGTAPLMVNFTDQSTGSPTS